MLDTEITDSQDLSVFTGPLIGPVSMGQTQPIKIFTKKSGNTSNLHPFQPKESLHTSNPNCRASTYLTRIMRYKSITCKSYPFIHS